ncbi:MAG: FecR family protein [Chitinophagaceae bacterium]|nr:FecR family protein [Chitinophagaceae bacterium]MBK8952279.1 FecR family protein [Chitinophagaceae bacterium]
MFQSDEDRILTLITRKLMGEATSSELEELSLLIADNPSYEILIQSLTHIWNTSPARDEDFLEATFLAHIDRMKKNGCDFDTYEQEIEAKRPWYSSRKLLVPVFSLLAVVAAFFFWPRQASVNTPVIIAEKEIKNEISTRNGNRTRIQLLDGSTVWLNAGSKLDYGKDFGGAKREVYLTGEAFFDVAKNPEKPFIIHTNAIDVKVIGTQFNVRCYPTDKMVETSLIKGSVEVLVKNRGEKWVLRPNEKLLVENISYQPLKKERNVAEPVRARKVFVAIKPLTYQNNDSVSVEAAWVKNWLSFKDESFAEVAQKMERWFDVEFEFRNESVKELSMYGTFTSESLQQALEALEFSFGFKYAIQGKKVIIY